MSADSAGSQSASAQGGAGRGEPSVAALLFVGLGGALLLNQWFGIIPGQDWLAASVVVAGLVAAVASHAPVLPWPNVLLAGLLAAFIGGMAEAVSAATGFPFGRGEFRPGCGPLFLGLMPWWLPCVWATFALSARGTARLVLHRFRLHPLHGYRVLALATALAGVSMMVLEALATLSAQFWTPGAAPILDYAAGVALHLVIQVALTPLLIDKFPGERAPNFQPLVVWAGGNLLFLAALCSG